MEIFSLPISKGGFSGQINMLKKWLAPIVIAGLMFGIVRPVLAQTVTPETSLEQFVISGSVEVGSEMGENGFRQIYYIWNDQKIFITDTNYSNGHPDTENENITWMGQSTDGSWQIFLYNLISKSTIQLSASLNNANPQVSGGKVAWEGWVNNAWQIFLYDGIKVSQITSGVGAINPQLDRNYLVFSMLHESGQWKSVAYSFSQKKSVDLLIGPETKHAKLKDGQIIMPRGTSVSVSSIFALDIDLSPDTATPSATTVEEILEELALPATDSGSISPEPNLPDTDNEQSDSSDQPASATPLPTVSM